MSPHYRESKTRCKTELINIILIQSDERKTPNFLDRCLGLSRNQM